MAWKSIACPKTQLKKIAGDMGERLKAYGTKSIRKWELGQLYFDTKDTSTSHYQHQISFLFYFHIL